MRGKPLPLQLRPGVVRHGTVYEARGRWYDTRFTRWIDGSLQPWGGWAKLQDSVPADVTLGEEVRGMFTWVSDFGVPHLVFGGPTKLRHYAGGTQTDITPADLKDGAADESEATGVYGLGTYGGDSPSPLGGGLYGTGDNTTPVRVDAGHWQFDNAGEDLLAVHSDDRRLLLWEPSVGGAAARLEGSPDCRGVVVTPEGFIVAIAASADPRRVAWSDQDDRTDWTPTVSNSAGGFSVQDEGRLLAGRATRSETLLWTTKGLHALRYIGGDLIYRRDRVSDDVGAISSRAMTLLGERAFWMGHRAFYVYDGASVNVLPDDVADYVFDDIDRDQLSKVSCFTREDFGEVVWVYPSDTGAGECDRYVAFNVMNNAWTLGSLDRTDGVDGGVFALPLAADSNGQVYEHETGSTYLDTDGATPLTPYAETGPVEIADGEQVMHIMGLVPDETGSGSVQYRIYTANSPTGAETSNGPFTTAEKIDLRLRGRQVRYRVEHVSGVWEHGTPRLLVQPGGRRW